MTAAQRMIFVDTETTGLDPRQHRVWDLAYIIRDPGKPDREYQTFIDVPLDRADLFALNVGHFWQRHPFYGGDAPGCTIERAVAHEVALNFRDAIIVGAVPWFDANMLTELLYRNALLPTWHYHLVDVETLAAGHLSLPPRWDFDAVLDRFGLVYSEADRHTAIGDARMARDLYDAVMARRGGEDRWLGHRGIRGADLRRNPAGRPARLPPVRGDRMIRRLTAAAAALVIGAAATTVLRALAWWDDQTMRGES